MIASATTHAGLIPCGQADRAACGAAVFTDATDADMHYYEHHIGDYAAATSHLSFAEDAAYSRLLRIYYRDEKPLPADLKAVQRLAGAREKAERDAVEVVLSEFFALEADGWHNKRADQEIARYNDKQVDADQRRENEAERQRRHRERRKELFDELRAYGEVPKYDTATNELERMLSRVTGRDSTQLVTRDATATHTQSPDTNKSKSNLPSEDRPQPAAADPCPHDAILALWAEVMPELRQPRTWGGTRRQHLRSRWREDAERQSLDWWRGFFAHIRKSDFLMGRVQTHDRRPFDLGLDWLVMPTNFAKVQDGNYHEAEAA